jgi:DNA-binding NtrC family response regulator
MANLMAAAIETTEAEFEPVVLVCEDRFLTAPSIATACRREGARAESLHSSSQLAMILSYVRPCAIISTIAFDEQDGFEVLKEVASFDRHLPILMVTGRDPVLHGALDAIEELWGLTNVSRVDEPWNAAGLKAFLARTGAIAGDAEAARAETTLARAGDLVANDQFAARCTA